MGRIGLSALVTAIAPAANYSVEGFIPSPSLLRRNYPRSKLAASNGGLNTEHVDSHDAICSHSRRDLLTSACAVLISRPQDANAVDVEAKSPFIAFSKTFLTSDSSTDSPIDSVAWDAPKQRGLNTEQMSDAVNDRLREREWFVTGIGAPELFSDDFTFSDPDVSLRGYEAYCRQVRRLFDQDTARCEVICCSVTAPNTITVLWRNSGKVTLGPFEIELKPCVVRTTLRTDGDLIVSQVDEFDSDSLGLLLYQAPLLRPLAGPPAPNVDVLRQQCNFNTCELKN